jgi:S-adenosylmethionine-diacylgycerolhomoserine-N-methlytransferase
MSDAINFADDHAKIQEFALMAESVEIPIDVEHAEKMDTKYGEVRHSYDLTRLFFLWGRNRAIKYLKLGKGKSVIEIGCGTGRNLKRMAKRYPGASIFGIDISREMLMTCADKIGRYRNVRVARADAMNFNALATFEEKEFDAVLMSFSLSMVPDWKRALYQGLSVLAVDGTLSVVDFGSFERFGQAGKLAISELGKHQAPPITTLVDELPEVIALVGKDFEVKTWRGLGGFNRFVVIKRIG